jgi:hypothetical protein
MRFHKERPYGEMCPPYRGVRYVQDGHYFTAEGVEVTEEGKPIGNGKAESPKVEIESPKVENVTSGEVWTAESLIEAAPTMAIGTLKKHAKPLLEGKVPSLKADVVSALKAKVSAVAPVAEAPKPVSKGMTWDSLNGNPAPINGVDLYAWATGGKEYLMGDVYKAIRVKDNKVVNNARDAINHLIDSGFVPPEIARNV